jgi:hypothetical protein
VSNGNATPQVLEYLHPWLDLYKVDLKSFDDRHYHELGGRIGPILESIRRIHGMGLWLEIVTLLIPGFNDSTDELRRLTEFLSSISPDIPWHVTAFHGDYKMTNPRDTRPEDLLRAVEIGQQSGLRYIYAGNLPGAVGKWENTRCPQCGETAIERYGYMIMGYRLTPEGRCPHCRTAIPGRWAARFEVRLQLVLSGRAKARFYIQSKIGSLRFQLVHAKTVHPRSQQPCPVSASVLFASRFPYAPSCRRPDRTFGDFPRPAAVSAAHRRDLER